jgi:voltage-gated potassium channel
MLAMGLAFLSLLRLIRSFLSKPESRALLFMAVFVLLAGTVFYHGVEHWRWLDSLYFCIVTLATIGYGDFTPKTDIGKAFTIVYVILGLGILAGFFSLVGQHSIETAKRLAEARSAKAQPVAGEARSNPDPV